jgi:hypothetical protein
MDAASEIVARKPKNIGDDEENGLHVRIRTSCAGATLLVFILLLTGEFTCLKRDQPVRAIAERSFLTRAAAAQSNVLLPGNVEWLSLMINQPDWPGHEQRPVLPAADFNFVGHLFCPLCLTRNRRRRRRSIVSVHEAPSPAASGQTIRHCQVRGYH